MGCGGTENEIVAKKADYFYPFYSGCNYFTGKKLTKKERVVKGVFGAGGMALDVVTLGADRVVVGAGERAAEVGVEKAAQSEARNVAEKQSIKSVETKNKNFTSGEGFSFRKLPSKLRLQRKEKQFKKELVYNNGLSKILEKLWQIELNNITSCKKIPFGGSCLIVARVRE